MKKWKELLWIFIPLVVLTIADFVTILWSYLRPHPELPADFTYTLSDPELWINVCHGALFVPVLCTVLFALPLGLVVRWLPLSRRMKYVLLFSGAVLCVGLLFFFTGLHMRVFKWYNILHCAHIGSTVVFFVWLAECVWTAVKRLIQGAKQ